MIIGRYRLPYPALLAFCLMCAVFDFQVAIALNLVIAYCVGEDV